MKQIALTIASVSCALSAARGQGLMDIGTVFDDGARLPFSFSLSSSTGWDSNPRAASSRGNGAGMMLDGPGSAYWQNAFSLHLPLGHGRNRFNLDANYSNTWNFDPPPGTQEFRNSGGLSADYFRQVNERLSIQDAAHFSHQTEPDFQVGDSISRPNSGYFSGSNSLSASYKWTTRFSTVTSYRVSAVTYDDEALQEEDNIQQVFSEKFRYSLTMRTRASLDYRFSVREFPDNPAADSYSHYILLGVDRPLGRFLSLSLSAGEEFRYYDGSLGNRASPYYEAAVNYHARANTTFRWYFRSGLEDTGGAGKQSNYSRRTGLAMTQVLAHGLSLNLSVNHIDTDSTRSTSGSGNRNEKTLHASAGLNYTRHLWRRFNLNASYFFSTVSSDDPFSEYERHLVSLGVSAAF